MIATTMTTNGMRMVIIVVGLAASCSPCRGVEQRVVALKCDTTATFEGEIHVDSPGAMTNFLSTECIRDDDAAVAAAVATIDFTTEGAFFARGLRATPSGCVNRSVDTTEVCDDGLRLNFADQPDPAGTCPGYWEALLALPRDELRAAVGP